MAISLALMGTLVTTSGVVNASEKTYTFEAAKTIFVKSTSDKNDVYEMKNGKIVKTNSKVDVYDDKGTPKYWKVNKVNVNGKNWYQIAENKYFSTKGADVLDVSKGTESNPDEIKYANYTPDLPTYNGNEIVYIAADAKSDSMSIDLYKNVNGKLVDTGRSVNSAKGFSTQYWKADKVNIGGQDCWQVGDNLYFSSPRVEVLNTKLNDAASITNYGNYPDSSSNSTSDSVSNEIFLINAKGDYVPVMALQNDGSFTKISNRALMSNTNWKIDKIRNHNGKIYARVATNEWINVTDYAVQNQRNYIN